MAEALVVRHLSKRFGGLRAVQDLSFSVAENETVALIGPNGAGKTTSFNLITGYHRPDAGSVFAFGREIVGLRPHDICAHGLARTFQNIRLFASLSVFDNVRAALQLHRTGGIRDARDLHALRDAGVAAAISGKALLEELIPAEDLQPFLPTA